MAGVGGWPAGSNAAGEGGTALPEFHGLPLLPSSIRAADAFEAVRNRYFLDDVDQGQRRDIWVFLHRLSTVLTLPTCDVLLAGSPDGDHFMPGLRSLPFLHCVSTGSLQVEKLIMQEVLRAMDAVVIDEALQATRFAGGSCDEYWVVVDGADGDDVTGRFKLKAEPQYEGTCILSKDPLTAVLVHDHYCCRGARETALQPAQGASGALGPRKWEGK